MRDSDERQTVLLQLSDEMRTLSDPAEIQAVAVQRLGEALQVDRCYYTENDWNRRTVVVTREYHASDIAAISREHPLEQFESLQILAASGKPIVCDDIDRHPVLGQDAAAYRERGVQAFVVTPLVKEKRTAGLLCIVMTRPRHWTESEVRLLTEVADRTWAAVERGRIEIALRDREAQLALAVEIGAIGHWEYEIATGQLVTSAICRSNFGRREDQEFTYADLVDSVHPDDRERQAEAVDTAVNTRGKFEIEYRLITPDDDIRWVQVKGQFAAGETPRLVGVSRNITEQKQTEIALRDSEQRLRVVVAELQHRARNILTVIRSVFSRTVEAGGALTDMADHFRGRLDALARMQVVITQSPSGTADLENLIRDELLSVGVGDGPDVRLGGPDVLLSAKAAETFGLAVHELTTNALKYGALRTPGATLDIHWSTDLGYDEDRILRFTWTELGVPDVPAHPNREGFGRELIEEALPYRLGAETTLEFRGGGVRCSISLPLPAVDVRAPGFDG